LPASGANQYREYRLAELTRAAAASGKKVGGIGRADGDVYVRRQIQFIQKLFGTSLLRM
jgi:hypothetical protein